MKALAEGSVYGTSANQPRRKELSLLLDLTLLLAVDHRHICITSSTVGREFVVVRNSLMAEGIGAQVPRIHP